MQLGLYISGIAHGALILWLLFGGLFTSKPDEDLLQVSQISILSRAEFEALGETEPAPEAEPEPAPEPESLAPAVSASAPTRPTPPEQPTPEPPAPETPTPEPPAPETAPTNIDRVAPEPTPEPAPDVEVAPVEQAEIAPNETGDETQPAAPATAPEAATTEIVTEATELADLAPTRSVRPSARPNRPSPTPPSPTAEATPDTGPDTAPDTGPDPDADPIADAIAEAVANPAPETPAATETPRPSGPPLSQGEMRALQVSVGNCWNVGSLSSEAMQTTVVVGVSLLPDAKPEIGSIRLVSYTGGTEAAARRAYETARRAIIRCGASGYALPSEKYEQWRDIEMTFNPESMRIK